MKSYSEKTAAAVILRMLKSKEVQNRTALQYTFIDANGMQCALDGFRAYRLKMPIAGLPDMPKNCTPIQLEKVYEGPEKDAGKPLDAPTLDEVKNLLAHDQKDKSDGKRSGLYFFGHGLPVVNAKYLRDMLQVFPDAKLYWSGSKVAPILVKSEYGDGILLPIRWNLENDEKRIIPAPTQKKTAAPAFSLAAFAARYAA